MQEIPSPLSAQDRRDECPVGCRRNCPPADFSLYDQRPVAGPDGMGLCRAGSRSQRSRPGIAGRKRVQRPVLNAAVTPRQSRNGQLCRRQSLQARPPLKVNEEQPAVSGVPERALAVLGAGTGDLLGFRHIHPPSTIQRCAVQERESSAASHNNSRATSSGYSLRGRHWLRRIESSASGVTQ